MNPTQKNDLYYYTFKLNKLDYNNLSSIVEWMPAQNRNSNTYVFKFWKQGTILKISLSL